MCFSVELGMAEDLSISFHGKKDAVKANNQSCDGRPPAYFTRAYFTLARAFSKFP